MADSADSNAELEVRRRRLLFRAWHRGMREVDLIMGRFADHGIPELGAEELGEFEQLLEMADRELLAWVRARALPSGVLPEQADPFTGAPLSVSPLTWSHGTFCLAVREYVAKGNELGA